MIRYTLSCDAGHGFESWFRDSAAFDAQRGGDLVTCPICLSTRVSKSIMAPALLGHRGEAETRATVPAPSLEPSLGAEQRAIRERIGALRNKILADGHDVGTRFPEEARRIHDGEAPMRQIHGQATREEARALLEDGILILPVPSVPDGLN